MKGPQSIQAPLTFPKFRLPTKCIAKGCGFQLIKRLPEKDLSIFFAKGKAARTAQTPEGGLKFVRITPQSPTAKTLDLPIALKDELVNTRPTALTIKPLS